MDINKEQVLVFMNELFHKGYGYHEISLACEEKFGIKYSDDNIRWHVSRKNKVKEKKTLREELADQHISHKLIVSDLHIPYECDNILEIVNQHKDEIDEIIFNGDVVDCFEISKFKSINKMPLVEEMEAAHDVLRTIDLMTPDIRKVLVKGNHESRWAKYLAETDTSLTPLHSPNIMNEIISGFTNNDYRHGVKIIHDPLTNYNVVDSWYYHVHDIICCHPISFSKIKARTTTMAIDYFIQQGEEFNAIVLAHTHKQSFVRHYGKLGYEQGCLCNTMPYSTNGKLNYTPQDNGYMIASFKNEKFQPNESRLFIL